MSQRLSNEIIIDGKLMNIGKSSAWRDQIFQINHGVDVGPADPGVVRPPHRLYSRPQHWPGLPGLLQGSQIIRLAGPHLPLSSLIMIHSKS